MTNASTPQASPYNLDDAIRDLREALGEGRYSQWVQDIHTSVRSNIYYAVADIVRHDREGRSQPSPLPGDSWRRIYSFDGLKSGDMLRYEARLHDGTFVRAIEGVFDRVDFEGDARTSSGYVFKSALEDSSSTIYVKRAPRPKLDPESNPDHRLVRDGDGVSPEWVWAWDEYSKEYLALQDMTAGHDPETLATLYPNWTPVKTVDLEEQ